MENHPTFNTEMNNVPNITPNPTPNITSNPTLNTPTPIPTELKSPKKEDNDGPLTDKDPTTYNVEGDDNSSKLTRSGSPPNSTSKETQTHRRRLLENYLQQQQQQHMFGTEKKNEIERYLAEEPLSPMTSSFNILQWWKENSIKYKILSLIAKDVLTIPVSTVASKSTFSTSSRILDSFRSSLSPKWWKL